MFQKRHHQIIAFNALFTFCLNHGTILTHPIVLKKFSKLYFSPIVSIQCALHSVLSYTPIFPVSNTCAMIRLLLLLLFLHASPGKQYPHPSPPPHTLPPFRQHTPPPPSFRHLFSYILSANITNKQILLQQQILLLLRYS